MKKTMIGMVVLLSACVQHRGGPILMNGNDITHTVVQKKGPHYTIEKRVFTTTELALVDFTAFLANEIKTHASELCQGEENVLNWTTEIRDFITLKHGVSHWEMTHKREKQTYPTGMGATASFSCTNQAEVEQ